MLGALLRTVLGVVLEAVLRAQKATDKTLPGHGQNIMQTLLKACLTRRADKRQNTFQKENYFRCAFERASIGALSNGRHSVN